MSPSVDSSGNDEKEVSATRGTTCSEVLCAISAAGGPISRSAERCFLLFWVGAGAERLAGCFLLDDSWDMAGVKDHTLLIIRYILGSLYHPLMEQCLSFIFVCCRQCLVVQVYRN
jgi:hypothetical protein